MEMFDLICKGAIVVFLTVMFLTLMWTVLKSDSLTTTDGSEKIQNDQNAPSSR